MSTTRDIFHVPGKTDIAAFRADIQRKARSRTVIHFHTFEIPGTKEPRASCPQNSAHEVYEGGKLVTEYKEPKPKAGR